MAASVFSPFSRATQAAILSLLPFCGNVVFAAEKPRANRVATEAVFKSTVVPLVEKCCLDCHAEDDPEGDVSLHDLKNSERVLANRDAWEKALKLLRIDGMPPEDYDPRPTLKQRETLTEWLELKLHHVDCNVVDDPGRVTIRRLNRVEYNNTIRDLLGVDIRPADDFPSDDVGYGFSNMADVLSLPPLLFEKYVAAAEKVSAAAIATVPPGDRRQRFQDKQLKRTGGARPGPGGFQVMASSGSVYREQDVKLPGEYIVRVEAAADQAGSEAAKMQIRIDGKPVTVHEIRGHRQPATYESRHHLGKGRRRIEAAFINDYYNPKAKNPKDRDRNLAVRFIELQGPSGAAYPAVHRRIVFTRPSKQKSVARAAAEIFTRLMPRAFRRPVDDAEVGRIVKLVESVVKRDKSFEQGVQVGLQAVLLSPHFLFRIEYDPRPDDVKAKHAVSGFELASRLSYFLWSTMPDDELFRLAGEGTLHEPATLRRQVARMLDDPQADALVENFAGQWLNLGNLAEVTPDRKLFPEFTPQLRADMIRETHLFVRTLFRENRSLLEFLDGDFTFVNERLAKHYGIRGVSGDEFRRVSLPAGQRAGVLTHASILTLTSNPNRTSLVRRGVWIVDNVLGLDLPDPPANVPSLEEGAKKSGASTLRAQLKLHREMPACASCHNTLDPLGFGLENFDTIGRWREKSEGRPVDARGTLPSGESFSGPIELVRILKKRERRFAELATRKMLTYALGRGLQRADSCAVDDIVADLQANGYRFRVLVGGIVESRPFLMRRGDRGDKQ